MKKFPKFILRQETGYNKDNNNKNEKALLTNIEFNSWIEN